jgi:hypothetical protein
MEALSPAAACVRCTTPLMPDEDDFCGLCDFQIRLEADYGLRHLVVYLAHWAHFRAWERDQGVPPDA